MQARFDFNDPGEPVLVKVGLSAVSVEGAQKNLAAEIPAWDFQGTVAAAAKSWSDVLGKIEIETSDPATRETFYTALYHSCIAPTLFNDADGSYFGLDHKVHGPDGFQNYCTFSLWDTFRAEHPLLTIIQPQRVDDFVATMLAHYRQFNQHSLPVWSLAGNETWCMIGNHAIPVIAEAYAKGFRGFDAEAAYQAMRDTVMQDRNFQNEYRERGYITTSKDKKRQAVRIADVGIRLRRLVRRANGQATRQEGRRRAVRQASAELSERVRSGHRIHARQVRRREVAGAVRPARACLCRLYRGHLVELHLVRAAGRSRA